MSRKIAVITGGSRGLGRSMALHLAERDVDSIITYRTAEAEAKAVVAAIEAKKGKAVAIKLDVADIPSFAAFADAVDGALRALWNRDQFDYLVNNGGTGASVPFLETSETTFDEMMNVHLKGPFFLTQELAPRLADDIGGAVALLLAPENEWITGQRIEASGGMLL